MIYLIYNIAKKLGQSEKFIEDTYGYTEIAVRSLCDQHDQYIMREMNK